MVNGGTLIHWLANKRVRRLRFRGCLRAAWTWLRRYNHDGDENKPVNEAYSTPDACIVLLEHLLQPSGAPVVDSTPPEASGTPSAITFTIVPTAPVLDAHVLGYACWGSFSEGTYNIGQQRRLIVPRLEGESRLERRTSDARMHSTRPRSAACIVDDWTIRWQMVNRVGSIDGCYTYVYCILGGKEIRSLFRRWWRG